MSTKKETTSSSSKDKKDESKERELLLKVMLPTASDPFYFKIDDDRDSFYEFLKSEARSDDNASEILKLMDDEEGPNYDPFIGDREVDPETRLSKLETKDVDGNDVIDVRMRVRKRN